MVDINAQRLGSNAQTVLEERDLVGFGVIAASAAGGVIVSQYIADYAVSSFTEGDSPDPDGVMGYSIAIGAKGLTAAGFGYAAAQLSGIGLVAAGLMGIGALASAGTDFVEFLLTTDVAGDVTGEQTRQRQATVSTTTSSNTPSASTSSPAKKVATSSW